MRLRLTYILQEDLAAAQRFKKEWRRGDAALTRSQDALCLIRAVQRGFEIVTEHEIASERGPCRVLQGKMADGIVIADDGACVWVECENSKKDRAERHKTCGPVQNCIGHTSPVELALRLWVARVAVVAPNEQALRWMAASFQQAHRDGLLRDSQVGDVNVCLMPLTDSLIPVDSVDENMWWDILIPSSA